MFILCTNRNIIIKYLLIKQESVKGSVIKNKIMQEHENLKWERHPTCRKINIKVITRHSMRSVAGGERDTGCGFVLVRLKLEWKFYFIHKFLGMSSSGKHKRRNNFVNELLRWSEEYTLKHFNSLVDAFLVSYILCKVL